MAALKGTLKKWTVADDEWSDLYPRTVFDEVMVSELDATTLTSVINTINQSISNLQSGGAAAEIVDDNTDNTTNFKIWTGPYSDLPSTPDDRVIYLTDVD